MKYQETTAHIEKLAHFTYSILHLTLTPERFIDYHAGQYLQILLKNAELCYSIANAPLGSQQYELHIRHNHDNPMDQHLLNELHQQKSLTLRLPLGQCNLAQLHRNKPILFIAAGTGFAPVHAMMEQLLASHFQHPLKLIWRARTKNDLYLDKKIRQPAMAAWLLLAYHRIFACHFGVSC